MWTLRNVWRCGLSLVGAAALATASWSQLPEANGKRVAIAKFTNQKITVDGRPDEEAWQQAVVTSGFTQREPEEGKPSTELTEVRVLFDNENLYIAAYCHDSEPSRIVINDIRRDFDSGEQDYFGVILDTFDDDSNGYYLTTTPAGGQRDMQFFNEGRDNNVSWDGVWYAEAKLGEDGYTVEMAIPFKTVRFSRERVQLWGAQFFRRIRRGNQGTYWSALPRRYAVTRGVSFAGELQGIENVEPGRNLQVKPYALAGVRRFASRNEGTEGEYDGGLDVKYGITPGLILDLTANTDFSHVEADTQQVNLTRFPLFFQEKREFFLENAGIFEFGSLGNSEALLFHSRTIGLENGQPIPILGGARLTGRAGRNYVGLMNMQTRSENSTPATNFTATRLRRDILANSDIGVIFLNRQSRLPNDHNRTFGADAGFLFFQTDLRLNAGLAKTSTPGLDGNDMLGKLEGEYQNNLVRVLSSYVDIQENFNPEMGFVRQPGRRIIHNELELKGRLQPEAPLGGVVRDIFLSAVSEHILTPVGETETKLLRPQLLIEFQDGSTLRTLSSRYYEHLEEPFELPFDVRVPVADYRFNRYVVEYSSNSSKPLSGSYQCNWGDFYEGRRTEHTVGLQLRPNYRFSLRANYHRNGVTLPYAKFHTDEVGLRVDYSFNPKMFLNAFIQYNNETDQVSSNIRFRLIHRPLSDIYVVYNDLRDRARDRDDRSLSLKYTHLLNF